ncbi:hypothetical protein ACFP1I_32705 [Dyadobacter subterraneus]|uniref:Uncharacterized protein n=1 Tax=Dyadobacter subterraneus TaxID=2773304 RepID=A0ABR9W8M9_9BACT|nr:hypothetical protein [Dyadobacter subterraneus]MBE9460761.1 hypothetical protein [Dyadobacter subterraneus]
MELKDPHARLFLFSAFLIVELVLLILIFRKDNDYNSIEGLLDSQLLLTILLLISFSNQLWKAYREIKKTGEENDSYTRNDS